MKKLPRNVYPKGPSLYYVRKNKWIRLCRIDAPEEELHRELWKILSKGAGTLAAVMDDFIANRLPKKAMSTQRDYTNIIKRQLRPTFGHLRPDDVTQQDIAVYLENRDKKDHGPAGNREIACFSSIFNHGMRIRACNVNPCYGVRRNTEKPRTRAVTDRELRHALRRAHVSLRRLLWAAYLTGFRQKDLRSIRRDQITVDVSRSGNRRTASTKSANGPTASGNWCERSLSDQIATGYLPTAAASRGAFRRSSLRCADSRYRGLSMTCERRQIRTMRPGLA